MKITTVTVDMDGLYDDDHPPAVYSGHLTEKRIDTIAREFGGLDTQGYQDYAVIKVSGGIWLVEYSNEENAERCDEGGIRNAGDMKLHIHHTELS